MRKLFMNYLGDRHDRYCLQLASRAYALHTMRVTIAAAKLDVRCVESGEACPYFFNLWGNGMGSGGQSLVLEQPEDHLTR